MTHRAIEAAETPRYYMAPADEGGKGRECIPLVRAIVIFGEAWQLPPRVACKRLHDLVRAGRLAVVAFRSDGEAVDGDAYVWKQRVPDEVLYGKDLHRPVYWHEGDAMPCDRVEGRSGVVDTLAVLPEVLGDELSLENAARQFPADRMGLLLDEVRAFCEAVGDVECKSALKARGPGIVQPEGGQWPHKKRAGWTNPEREALFLMRHRDKKTGEDLAEIAGVSRQAIDEVIGPERPAGGRSTIKAKSKGWSPSAELLKKCGAPLQPLQSTAAALAG